MSIERIDNERIRVRDATINIAGTTVRGVVLVNKNKDAEFFKYSTVPGVFSGTTQELDGYPTFVSDSSNNYNWRFVEKQSAENLLKEIKEINPGISPSTTQEDLQRAFYNSTTTSKGLNEIRINAFASADGFNSPATAETLPGGRNVARRTPDGRVIPPGSSQTGVSNIPPEEASLDSPAYNASNDDAPKEIITEDDLNIEQITADNDNRVKWWYNSEPIIYPTDITKNNQDYIKFQIFEYVTRKLGTENPLLLGERGREKNSKATIVLPIQPSITDTNTVDWSQSSLNPVEIGLLGLSDAGMNANTDATSILGKMGNTVTQDSNVEKAIKLYLKQKAVNVEGLLSRFGGAVVNPNMELLFQGPILRPFNFSFRLSPRNNIEAKNVKKIIRIFKEAMAVRTASGGLFLAAPHTFEINYINGSTGNGHGSLNRIKTCALQSCSVDYAPDNTYMTFNDEDNEHPMTSYNLTLQFQELEPVTDKDYDAIEDKNAIGY